MPNFRLFGINNNNNNAVDNKNINEWDLQGLTTGFASHYYNTKIVEREKLKVISMIEKTLSICLFAAPIKTFCPHVMTGDMDRKVNDNNICIFTPRHSAGCVCGLYNTLGFLSESKFFVCLCVMVKLCAKPRR